jgi:hypothetical protein
MSKNNEKSTIFSTKGSALIMVVVMMMVISILGASIVMLTINNFEMSIFYSEYNKAFFIAESGAERIIKVLDEKIASIQENSRKETSVYLQDTIQNNPLSLRTTVNNDGSINYESLENEFNSKYLEFYYQGLNNELASLTSLDYRKELLDTDLDIENKAHFEFQNYGGSVYLNNIEFDETNKIITIETEGIYNEYIKKLSVKIDLNSSISYDSESAEYKISVMEEVNKKPEIPSIFFNRALLSEKNIMVMDGTLNVNGDVTAFGTVPTDAEGKEDKDASSYDYGGIIAGITPNFAVNDEYFGFDSDITGDSNIGKININGNASTMGYIHSLYGVLGNSGDINISGNSYARAVVSEYDSNYSNFTFNNVCTLDNLQVDSNLSNVEINGKYYGIVDAGYMIDGTSNNTEEKMIEDEYNYKRTSSVVINGDSKIYFNDEIYIGGSSFLVDFLEEGTSYPYMTGVSALKSNRRLYNAYTKEGTEDNLYWFENGNYEEPNPEAYYKKYDNEGTLYDMLNGKNSNPGYFPIVNRAMHLKGLWDKVWSLDDLYLAYLNLDNIIIAGNGIDGENLKGYSNGSIIANGKVYGINDFEGGHDPVAFHGIQNEIFEKYYNSISDFFIEEYDSDLPKLDYVNTTDSINNLVDSRFIGENRIGINIPYVSDENPSNGIMFYGEGDVEIEELGGIWYINDNVLSVNKGIIFVDGNVYIGDNFEFTGVIVSSGNIIFLGDANISYDQSTVINLLNTDVNIKGLFKLLEYDIPDLPVERQRVVSDTFKIVDWKEIY